MTRVLIRGNLNTERDTRCTDRQPNEEAARAWLAIEQQRREASEEINPTDTSVLALQNPELWEIKFLFLKPPNLWHLVMTALANCPQWLLVLYLIVGLSLWSNSASVTRWQSRQLFHAASGKAWDWLLIDCSISWPPRAWEGTRND